MKKIAGVLGFTSLFMMSVVSAGPVEGVRQLLEGLRDIIYLIVQFLFNISWDLGIYDEYIFARLILLFIVYIVVYTVMKKSIFREYLQDGKPKPVIYIIAAAVAILSIRYLPNEFISAILLPYSTLGIAITVFFPLMIFFYFLQTSGLNFFTREIGWCIFAASFVALWYSRYESLGEANYVYWLGILFIIICMIFDKRIHRFFKDREYLDSLKDYNARLWAEHNARIADIDSKLTDTTLPASVRRSLERSKKLHQEQQAKIARDMP
jgi:hypothetical protein